MQCPKCRTHQSPKEKCGWCGEPLGPNSQARSAARKPYYAVVYSCDGLYEFEVAETPPDLPWPAMVRFEFAYGSTVVAGTMTAEDAKELAGHLGAAAELADHATREAVKP